MNQKLITSGYIEEVVIEEVLRYIAVPKEQADEEIKQEIKRLYQQTVEKSTPKWVKQKETLHIQGTEIQFVESGLYLESKDLANVLRESKQGYILAATLGVGADLLIKQKQRVNMSEAMILDACASVYIEQICDEIEAQIINELDKGEYMTMRYSPGYGDVTLTVQEHLLTILQAPKQLGLNVSRSGMLVPTKSVTAFIGISTRKQNRLKTCGNCMLRKTCLYRKRGDRCGN